jgi:osmotically-inducible protein OsmY
MKKSAAAILMAMTLSSFVACSNWNKMTPASMDSTAIEAEVRKNLTADKITGLSVDVNGSTVTLSGHLTRLDHDKAVADAQKVNGVNNVIDHITID